MTDTPTNSPANLMAQIDANIAAIEAKLATASATDYVLAWPSGLGMAFKNEGRDGYVVGVVHAEIVATQDMPEEAWAYTPQVVNGNGEKAQCVPFPTALQWALDGSRSSKAFLQDLIDNA